MESVSVTRLNKFMLHTNLGNTWKVKKLLTRVKSLLVKEGGECVPRVKLEAFD